VSSGGLFVGNYRIDWFRNGLSTPLLAVFQSDMYKPREMPAALYWATDEYGDEPTVVQELACSGRVMVDRLDTIGCTHQEVMEYLQDDINQSRERYDRWLQSENNAEMAEFYAQELQKYRNLDATTWVAELRRLGVPEESEARDIYGTSRTGAWLLNQLRDWDERYAVRVILGVFPEYDVRLDLTVFVEDEELSNDIPAECENAVGAIRGFGSAYSPVVVLTEGRSDAAVLTRALGLLYPHLTDMIRFMDFSRRPEGGAGPLVTTVRTFAGAGIANRLIAIFDNDSAAEDALTSLDIRSLPENIRILRYPNYHLASSYPTLGPPSIGDGGQEIRLADVNGLAGSIEMYLGKDVLMQDDGDLMPVQWRSYLPKVRRYQGALLDKSGLQDRFNRKAAAVEDGTIALLGGWCRTGRFGNL
jgi:hypothetical protein